MCWVSVHPNLARGREHRSNLVAPNECLTFKYEPTDHLSGSQEDVDIVTIDHHYFVRFRPIPGFVEIVRAILAKKFTPVSGWSMLCLTPSMTVGRLPFRQSIPMKSDKGLQNECVT